MKYLSQKAADTITDALLAAVPPYNTDGPGFGAQSAIALCTFLGDLNTKAITIGEPSPPATVNTFAEELARVAETQIGTQEDAQHTNRGSAILKYQQATNLGGQGWPWCAAFDDYCYQQAALNLPSPFPRPQTASAFGEIDWAKQVGAKVFTPEEDTPKRGDIVVYAFSHTGIVTGYTGGRSFAAVEGNTNPEGGSDGYGVFRKTRSFSEVKAFIRLG